MLIKDYKVNEAVLVTRYVLDSIYQKYYSSYPKEIEKKVVDLINDLRDNLEGQQDIDSPKCDIIDSYYIERIIFDDEENNKDNE